MFPKRMTRSFRTSLLLVGIVLLIFTGAAAFTQAVRESGVAHSYDNLLRMHVVANSDAPEDQRVKLKVRDALLEEMQSWEAPKTEAELERLLLANRGRLEQIGRDVLRREGHDPRVRVAVGNFEFPQKRSRDIVLPAGEYRAFEVVLGNGAGHNWWCVLFPPLCFVDEETKVDVGGRPAGADVVHEAERVRDQYGIDPNRAANRLSWDGAGADGEALRRPGERRNEADRPVEWRLRIWDTLSDSAYAETLRDILHVSLKFARDLSI